MEELPSSELGTKSYWDNTYNKELNNFEDIGDVGEIWFGEDNEERIIDWIVKWKVDEDINIEECRILDLGTGNGHFLLHLANEGFKNLCGVDYCGAAIQLAQAIAKKSDTAINFVQANILEPEESSGSVLSTKYKLCHDKGTYDAISLTPETAGQDRTKYMDSVLSILENDGIFIITSCNWTEDELLLQFKDHFEKVVTIPTPTFQFGGKIGSMITSLVLQKIPSKKI